jgi:hypothetical protein
MYDNSAGLGMGTCTRSASSMYVRASDTSSSQIRGSLGWGRI